MELLIQRAWTFLRLLIHVAELIFRRMTPVSIQIIIVSQHLLLLPHIQGLVLSSYSQGQLLVVPQLGPWEGRLSKCRQSVPFCLSFHCREGAGGGCRIGAELSREFAAMQPRHSWERVSAVKENQEAPSQPAEGCRISVWVLWGLFLLYELMNDRDDSEHSLQCSPVSEMANYVAKTPRAKRPTLNTLHLDNCPQLPFQRPKYRNTALLPVIPLCDWAALLWKHIII